MQVWSAGAGRGGVTVTELVVLLVLVAVNGLLAGAEIATVTLRKTRLQELVDEGRESARAVARLRAQPERFLATVQIGITVVGAAAGAFGGDTVAGRLAPRLEALPWAGPWLAPYAHQLAFAVVVMGISFLSLVLGELVPKSLALMAPERYALLVARPLLVLSSLARPIVWVLTTSSNLVLKVFGDKTSFTEARMSADEIKAMIEEASTHGGIDERASAIASRAIEFADLDVGDVLVPRQRVVGIERTATLDEIRRVVVSSGHSRLVVFDPDIDRIVGSLSVRDLFLRSDATVTELMRPVCLVPASVKAVELLHRLQSKGIHMGVIIDEHGGTVGIVTREDLIEELVGKMLDAEGEAAQHVARATARLQQAEGVIEVAAVATVRDLNREFDLALPEGDDWITVGGLCVARLGRIPVAGERVVLDDDTVITITDASARRVRSVRITSKALASVPPRTVRASLASSSSSSSSVATVGPDGVSP
jgi:putative hemolysin